MIRLFDCTYNAANKNKALFLASNFTGFKPESFCCEVIKPPKKQVLLKKEDGIFRCWYEYEGMNSDKVLEIADTILYFDTSQKRILVVRFGYKVYEIDYSDLIDYELVIADKYRTYTVQKSDKALKGALLFGVAGAIVGAANSKITSETVQFAELIIRLKFKSKESFDILTCNQHYEVTDVQWRNIVEQAEDIIEWLNHLVD